MNHARDPREPRTLGDMAGALVADIGDLARSELALARAEAAAIRDRVLASGAYFVLGGAFAVVSLTVLAEVAVGWLAAQLGSRAWAGLLVGVLAALGAAGFLGAGRRRLGGSGLLPRRTTRHLARDGEALAEKARQ